MNYYETDLNCKNLTHQELNKIALQNQGVVGLIGWGYQLRGELPGNLYGYGFRWVNSKGMGNHGRIILIGISREAKEYLRQGIVLGIMEDHGLSYAEADNLYTAAIRVRRGLETEVLDYVLNNRECIPAWKAYPKYPDNRWLKEWGMPHSLTSTRLEAAYRVIKAWKGWTT